MTNGASHISDVGEMPVASGESGLGKLAIV